MRKTTIANIAVIAAMGALLSTGAESGRAKDEALIYGVVVNEAMTNCATSPSTSVVLLGYTKPQLWDDFAKRHLAEAPASHTTAVADFLRRSADRKDVKHLLPEGYRVVDLELKGMWPQPTSDYVVWVSSIGFDSRREHAVVASGCICPIGLNLCGSSKLQLFVREQGKWHATGVTLQTMF